MSLKAYDGLMTTKDVKYVQDETIKRIDRFKDASENKLAEKYAEMVTQFSDENHTASDLIKWAEFGSDVDCIEKAKRTIKIEKDTHLISLIYRLSKIHSKAYFANDFTVHLNLTLEILKNRILIYPNILVQEHKKILLEYLEDWYCQDQSDPDEDVTKGEWEERSKDWYSFDENRGYKHRIQLLHPEDIFGSVNKHFRGPEMIKKILNHIPSDEIRTKRIAYNTLLKSKNITDTSSAMRWMEYFKLKDEGKKELEDYIKNTEILIIKIDEDYLKKPIVELENIDYII